MGTLKPVVRGTLAGLMAAGLAMMAGSGPATAADNEPRVTQGKVEQGTGEDHVFKSPMIIEMPLPSSGSSENGHWTSSGAFRTYLCDDVRPRVIETRLTRKKEQVRCDVRVNLYTEPGHDREVSLKLELLRGEKVLGTDLIDGIDAEEKKESSGSGSIRVPLDAWPDGEEITLRITMSVVKS